MSPNPIHQHKNPPLFVPNLLQSPNRRVTLTVERYFESLETLTPVRGTVTAVHKTTYLEVTGEAEAIASLTCDRCLCQYNQRLRVDLSEPIWLRETALDEAETPDWLDQEVDQDDELQETVPPQGHFDADQWLYEQMCLAIPVKRLCRPDCEGIAVETPAAEPEFPLDSRWAALSKLRELGE